MVTKLGTVVAYNKELMLIKLHDSSMTCCVRLHDKLSISYRHLHQRNGQKQGK